MGTLARNGLITLLLNNQVTKVYLAFSMIFKPSLTILHNCHCVKSVQIRSNVWSVFSRIRIEYGRYFVSLHIQSECGKIRTRNYSVFEHFSRSVTPPISNLDHWKLLYSQVLLNSSSYSAICFGLLFLHHL